MGLTTCVRTASLATVLALCGCGKSVQATSGDDLPTRRPGLWEQVVTRDGKPGRFAAVKICLDPSIEAKLGVFGRDVDKSKCERSVSRDGSGAYRFSSMCKLADGGVINSRGVATGDFKTAFDVHSAIDVTGANFEPMNGAHQITVAGRYLGDCPLGMKPGDVSLGPGMTVNMSKLPEIAKDLGGS